MRHRTNLRLYFHRNCNWKKSRLLHFIQYFSCNVASISKGGAVSPCLLKTASQIILSITLLIINLLIQNVLFHKLKLKRLLFWQSDLVHLSKKKSHYWLFEKYFYSWTPKFKETATSTRKTPRPQERKKKKNIKLVLTETNPKTFH